MRAREQLYVNPNHLQALAIRAAALAQLGRTGEAVEATSVLLGKFRDDSKTRLEFLTLIQPFNGQALLAGETLARR